MPKTMIAIIPIRELVRRILGYFRPHMAKMVIVSTVVFLSSLMDLALPIVISAAIDQLHIITGDLRPNRRNDYSSGCGQCWLGR